MSLILAATYSLGKLNLFRKGGCRAASGWRAVCRDINQVLLWRYSVNFRLRSEFLWLLSIFFAEFGGITGVPAYKREEWIENYWEKQPNFVAAVCDDIYIERQEQQHWGWEKLEKLCRKYFWRSGKARIFVFIYSLRSEMAGIVVGDFERICLSRPCVLTLLERVFSIYFRARWSGGRFCTWKSFRCNMLMFSQVWRFGENSVKKEWKIFG